MTRSTLGSPRAARLEVRLEDRLKHHLRRHLHHTVPDRRYAQRPLPPVCLRDVLPPNRLRSVLPRSEDVLKFREEQLDTPLLDHLQGLPVDAGSALVASHPPPRLQQNVTPPDPVVQRMEAALPIPLGCYEEPALEFSHFVSGVVGSEIDHALALTSAHRRNQSRVPSLDRVYHPASSVL